MQSCWRPGAAAWRSSKCSAHYSGPLFEAAGCLVPVSPQRLQDIQNLKGRPGDVYVASFTKAGTTWTQEMVYLIETNMNFEGAMSKTLQRRFPYLDMGVPPSGELSSLETLAAVPKGSTRFIKVHLPFHLLPKSVERLQNKVVYVARNPGDVIVSCYHFYSSIIGNYVGSLRNFFDDFIYDKLPYCPYISHVLGYWNNRYKQNILFITYEELQTDFIAVASKVAVFLGKTLTPEDLETLKQHCSFKAMRQNPSVNYMSEPVMDQTRVKFFRKGIVGDWQNSFDTEMIQTLKQWTDLKLRQSDFKFQFYLLNDTTDSPANNLDNPVVCPNLPDLAASSALPNIGVSGILYTGDLSGIGASEVSTYCTKSANGPFYSSGCTRGFACDGDVHTSPEKLGHGIVGIPLPCDKESRLHRNLSECEKYYEGERSLTNYGKCRIKSGASSCMLTEIGDRVGGVGGLEVNKMGYRGAEIGNPQVLIMEEGSMPHYPSNNFRRCAPGNGVIGRRRYAPSSVSPQNCTAYTQHTEPPTITVGAGGRGYKGVKGVKAVGRGKHNGKEGEGDAKQHKHVAHPGHAHLTHPGHGHVAHPGHGHVAHPGHGHVAHPGHAHLAHPGHAHVVGSEMKTNGHLHIGQPQRRQTFRRGLRRGWSRGGGGGGGAYVRPLSYSFGGNYNGV